MMEMEACLCSALTQSQARCRALTFSPRTEGVCASLCHRWGT